MATQLQIRRGTTSQMNAFTGAEGELAVNTTTDTVHVHDGSTAGGHALAKADGSNIAAYAGSFTTLAASGAATLNTLASSGATLTGGTINGVTVGATTPSTGAFTTIAASGAITGNVTGNLTGSVLTAAQTNITSVGTLTGLTLSGTFSLPNANATNEISFTGTEFTNVLSATTGGFQLGTTGAGYLSFLTNNTERMRLSGGNVGISTTDPKSTLEVKGTFGAPATSGSAAGFISRFSQSSGAGCLDVGFGDPYSWIQSRASNNYATNFDLVLQPNGGNLGVGVSPSTNFKGHFQGDAASAALSVGIRNTNSTGISRFILGNDVGLSRMTIGYNGSGYSAGFGASTGFIGMEGAESLVFMTNGAQRMTINSSGHPFFPAIRASAGSYTAKITAGSAELTFDASSARYKDNIRDSTYGLSAAMQLQSRMFEYKEDDQRTDVGFIAEEVNEVIPELVVIDGEGRPDAVNYDRMTSVLLKAIQELKEELNTATARITELENT